MKEKKVDKFYEERQKYTEIETLGKIKKNVIKLDKNIQQKFIDLKILILLNLTLKQML